MAHKLTAVVVDGEARGAELVVRLAARSTEVHGPVAVGGRHFALLVDADVAGLESTPGVLAVYDNVGPWPLASRALTADGRARLSADVVCGGNDVVVIAGPCAVEHREQVTRVARAVRDAGAVALRGGAFKPRTSPYAHQGLGRPGLELLSAARAASGLPIVTEVLDVRDVEVVGAVADVLQIGARNMQNAPLLREAGRSGKPVLLKRSFGATAAELLHAAEYVLSAGGANVVLCERGIRTFEPGARFMLDVGAVAWLKTRSRLPVIVDPSHAAGTAELVSPLALAGLAAGADGLLVEVHDAPDEAISDGEQALSPGAFADLMTRARALCAALGRTLSSPRSSR